MLYESTLCKNTLTFTFKDDKCVLKSYQNQLKIYNSKNYVCANTLYSRCPNKEKKGNTIHFNHRTAIPIEIYELQLYNFYIYVK